MTRATADLCDEHPERARPLPPVFADYGGTPAFGGPVSTLRVLEDWRPVLAALDEAGAGRVLVVDGGGSTKRAVLGERLLTRACDLGWAGVVIYGAVRDTALTRRLPIGLRALATAPKRGERGGPAERDVPVEIAGVAVAPGELLYADEDGIVVVSAELSTALT